MLNPQNNSEIKYLTMRKVIAVYQIISGLIGAFLTIDAASLLGKSSVGNDEQWVKDAGALRDLLRVTRTLKSEPKEVIAKTLGENAYEAFNALIASASRQTKTILVGPGAIALGFVALRAFLLLLCSGCCFDLSNKNPR